ncbi:hypothetical protein LNQ03_08210 [Klebsiella pneumoniae subsp. pneumoniae]|nr:hypothetical protein [Klebsiella pneumoniae subsp. pneumoniae]
MRLAWRQRDPRLTVCPHARLGSTRIFWLLTLPSLTLPTADRPGGGLPVSIAQYLPTLWLGLGLNSDAHQPGGGASSSGGEAQTPAAQRAVASSLPAVCFLP